MPVPEWRLPRGVSRSVWEFAHDRQIARDEGAHLAGEPLLEFDRQTVLRWFAPPARLIDLGCGTGRSLIDFSRCGFECTGVDLSAESLAVAAERTQAAQLPVLLVRGNLCDLGCLPAAQFDRALLMFGTLGMVTGRENRRAVLAETRRLLKPGGKLALHVHNVWRHMFSPPGRRWLLRDVAKRLTGDPTAGDTERDYRGIPRMYHHPFTGGEIRALLNESGFRICEMIPLAARDRQESAPTATQAGPTSDLICRGWFRSFRATGWLILAEAIG